MGLIADYDRMEAARQLKNNDRMIREQIDDIISKLNAMKKWKTDYVDSDLEIAAMIEYYKTRFDDIIKAF